ncbi:MAG: GFA family protein [Kordiimonas sp.]
MGDVRQGGCLCGAARYEIDVSRHETGNCHCSLCQKHTGSAYLTVTCVPIDDFKWLSKPEGRYASSEHAIRRFCTQCGTPITWESSDYPDIANVGIGTLDDCSGLTISHEIYTKNRLKGVEPVPGARQMKGGYEPL